MPERLLEALDVNAPPRIDDIEVGFEAVDGSVVWRDSITARPVLDDLRVKVASPVETIEDLLADLAPGR